MYVEGPVTEHTGVEGYNLLRHSMQLEIFWFIRSLFMFTAVRKKIEFIRSTSMCLLQLEKNVGFIRCIST